MRKPTEAQRQAAKEKRKRMQELAAKIRAMSDEERAGLVSRVGAVLTIERHPLSLFNSCMILRQAGNAPVSIVGGFQQWRKARRSVKKGEHGYCIWFPIKKGEKDEAPATVEALDNEEAKPAFGLGTVFDISQTEERTPEIVTPAQAGTSHT